MTTLALQVVGTAIAGPIGGIAGTLLGAYIDQAFIFPELFGDDAPRPESIIGNELTGASEGDPINVCFGRKVRVPGTIVWAGPKVSSSAAVGGKGGPGPNRGTMHKVWQDIAVKFCKGTKVEELQMIWAQNVLLFDSDPVASIQDHRYRILRLEITNPSGNQVTMRIIRIADAAPSIVSAFPPGAQITIAGATGSPAGANDGTFTVQGAVTHTLPGIQVTAGVTSIQGSASTDIVTVTMAATHGRYPGTEHPVRILAATGSPDILGQHDCTFTSSTAFTFPLLNPAASYSSPFFVASYNVAQEELRVLNGSAVDGDMGTASATGSFLRTAKKIRADLVGTLLWHDGDETIDETIDDIDNKRSPQVNDPTIEATEGIGGTWPMLGHAYFTVGGLLESDFGNATPTFTTQVVVDSRETTVSAIGKIAIKAGLTAGQINTSEASPDVLWDYTWRGVQKPSVMLQPLMILGDYVAQEDAGKLKIIDRTRVFFQTEPQIFQESQNAAVTFTSTTLTDTRQKWDVDEFVGALITSHPLGLEDSHEMTVTSNTADTLTGTWAPGTPVNGSSYDIETVHTTATTLVDSRQKWSNNRWAGGTVTSNGKTMTVATNTANTLTGAAWSGGGFPGSSQAYSIDPLSSDIPIDSNDLAARESGADAKDRLTIIDRSDVKVPTEVQLEYINIDDNHSKGLMVERDETQGQDNVLKVRVPLGLTEAQANKIATRTLWNEIANRDEATFTLPPSYLYLIENDRVTITEGGETYTVRLTKVDRGENGILECRGTIEQSVDLRPSGEVGVAST
jgi:hypothetical protein